MKKAVVLAGGGSRGGYQLGVWQAMRELNISFDIVTGTSVGALNGALMVQNDYEIAKDLWEHISNKDVMNLEGLEELGSPYQADKKERRQIFKNFLADVVKKGGADVTPLEELIHLYVNEDKLRNSPIDFGLITVEYPSFRELKLRKEDIPPGKIADFLLATAACFPAFQTREIEGIQYIDGGYYDNMPINLAISMGAEEVIAVDLDGIGFRRKIPEPLEKDIPITYIRSYWNLGNFLVFEKEITQRNIVLGYNDAMKAFGERDGIAYTFHKGEAMQNARSLYPAYHGYRQALTEGMSWGAASAIMDFAYHSVLDEVRKLRDLKKEMSLSEALTACGEICGEFFEADPVPVYSFEAFNRQLLFCYRELREDALKAVRAVTDKSINVREVIQLIQNIDRKHIICFIADRMEAFLKGEIGGKEMSLFATAFPRDTAAAFYVNMLVKSSV